MTGDEATCSVIAAINEAGIPYLLVGSLSSNFWGIPRSTQDADIVLDLRSANLQEILKRLDSRFKCDPQLSFEMVSGTKRNVIEVEGTEYKIELFRLSSDPHDVERFQRRQPAEFLGQKTFVASPEDVIITKLRWALDAKRSKDVDDVQNVIAVQANRIDWDYVYKWCDVHGTRKLLDTIRASIPEI